MTRMLRPAGVLAGAMGAGLVLPVVVHWLERSELTAVAVALLIAGGGLIALGIAAVMTAVRRGHRSGMPAAVRAAVAACILILAFLALELSDRFVRQDGRLFYWTTFLLPPALLVFYGLLAARPWAWWSVRIGAALVVLWFVGFVGLIPFVDLRADGVPVPWYGRVYMAVVSLAFAAVFAFAWWSLGHPASRDYFVIGHPKSSKTYGPGAAGSAGVMD